MEKEYNEDVQPQELNEEAEEAVEAVAEAEELSAEAALEQAEAQIAEWQDKYLRQAAEFDNFRKRTLKEKTELILNGGERVLKDFLPVLDDMERAMESIQKAADIDTLREGVELIYQKIQKTLEAQGLKKMETTGALFDTDYHEAIAMIPAADAASKGKIIDCVQAGYQLNDKVIRHAKVAVGE